jgi:hypothetical protein
MMKKSLILIGAVAWIFLGCQAFSAMPDETACKNLVIDSCTGCHGKERACDNLGKSKESWRSLIKFMIANGAELNDERLEQLSDCMSIPSLGAKAACADVAPKETGK